MNTNEKCTLRLTGDGYPDMLVGELVFSWMVSGITGMQASYRVTVSSAQAQEPDCWDSGWIDSAESSGIEYGGKAFESNREYRAVAEIITNTGGRMDWRMALLAIRPEQRRRTDLQKAAGTA